MAQDYKLGATFIPGLDDFYMPAEPVEIISPAPHKLTPEVPTQMQDQLAALELDSTEASKPSGLSLNTQTQSDGQASFTPASVPPSAATTYGTVPEAPLAAVEHLPLPGSGEEPNFSPLPKLSSRSDNVPPTYEERANTLERARVSVLTSSDPEVQLLWAEDALAYVENCIGYDLHTAATDGEARPQTPPSERQLRTDAINVTVFLADQGHPKAEFMRGMWFEFGNFGYAQNKPEAFRAYKRAAAKGYARAEYRMGLQFESTNEPMKALQHYKAGEALSDPASCYRVGMMCLMGQLGQSQDFVAGVRLIRYAADTADLNIPQGAYVFGMLLAGELTQAKVPETFLPPDLGAARMYIEKAAYLGFSKAQLKMGYAYEFCTLGCDFDVALAMQYMALAARQGEPEAEMALSKWFLCGYEDLFAKNNELAFRYANRAAAALLDTAEFAVGYFYEVGINVPVNIGLARTWYEKASKNGNADAKGRLEALSTNQPAVLSKNDHEQVALKKIRSQYGSRRIRRPDGVVPMQNSHNDQQQQSMNQQQQQQQQQQQPPPPPSNRPPPPPTIQASQNPAPIRTANSSNQPLRTKTPYPVDDDPPYVPLRAKTATPYPLDDMLAEPTPFRASNGAPHVTDHRPYSNIPLPRPPLHPNTFPNQAPLNHPAGQMRPNTTTPVQRPRPPPGRPPPNQAAPPPRAGYYPPSRPGPPISQRPNPGAVSGANGNQRLQGQFTAPPSTATGARKPVPSSKSNVTTNEPPSVPSSVTEPTLPDIGFSAPVDVRADYRNRNRLSPPGQTSGAIRPMMVEQRIAGSGRGGGGQSTSMAPTPNTLSESINGNSNTTSTGPSASKLSKPAPPSSSTTNQKPPSKTFEEMGVPASKKEHDCIIM